MFPADFGWSDLGTWGALYEPMPQDLNKNVCIGENIQLYDTRNCIIHTAQEKKVVVMGLDGFIVAEKDNALLICKASEEQKIQLFTDASK